MKKLVTTHQFLHHSWQEELPYNNKICPSNIDTKSATNLGYSFLDMIEKMGIKVYGEMRLVAAKLFRRESPLPRLNIK